MATTRLIMNLYTNTYIKCLDTYFSTKKKKFRYVLFK